MEGFSSPGKCQCISTAGRLIDRPGGWFIYGCMKDARLAVPADAVVGRYRRTEISVKAVRKFGAGLAKRQACRFQFLRG